MPPPYPLSNGFAGDPILNGAVQRGIACVEGVSFRRVPKTGGAAETLATAQTGAADIAVDGAAIYWTVALSAPWRGAQDGKAFRQKIRSGQRGSRWHRPEDNRL